MTDTPRALKVEQVTLDGVDVFRLRGAIDWHTAPQLRQALLHAVDQGAGALVLDLTHVPYVDSSGVGTMVLAKREYERAGRRVVLLGVQARVRSVLEVTRLEHFFTLVERVDEVRPR